MESIDSTNVPPIFQGRGKDQFDLQPGEKVVQTRQCGQGCVIIIIEKQGVKATLKGVFGKHQRVEPEFRPLDERYSGDSILEKGFVELKANQRMVVRQGERVFQNFPPAQNK